jgi:phosphoribosyl 1,2-cyclic phosphodiesterase
VKLDADLLNNFVAHETMQVGSLQVTAFPKQHDAADPYSFVVSDGGVTVGVMTDIGQACDNVIRYFKTCHAVYLEANYDVMMLETGRYPYHLKQRIRSDRGHLSNTQALELFSTHGSSFLSHVFLSHLSKENNHPDTALAAFREYCGNTKVVVASRYEETPVFTIEPGFEANSRRPFPVQTVHVSAAIRNYQVKQSLAKEMQLGLFG